MQHLKKQDLEKLNSKLLETEQINHKILERDKVTNNNDSHLNLNGSDSSLIKTVSVSSNKSDPESSTVVPRNNSVNLSKNHSLRESLLRQTNNRYSDPRSDKNMRPSDGRVQEWILNARKTALQPPNFRDTRDGSSKSIKGQNRSSSLRGPRDRDLRSSISNKRGSPNITMTAKKENDIQEDTEINEEKSHPVELENSIRTTSVGSYKSQAQASAITSLTGVSVPSNYESFPESHYRDSIIIPQSAEGLYKSRSITDSQRTDSLSHKSTPHPPRCAPAPLHQATHPLSHPPTDKAAQQRARVWGKTPQAEQHPLAYLAMEKRSEGLRQRPVTPEL